MYVCVYLCVNAARVLFETKYACIMYIHNMMKYKKCAVICMNMWQCHFVTVYHFKYADFEWSGLASIMFVDILNTII